jgi:hypothetical protein
MGFAALPAAARIGYVPPDRAPTAPPSPQSLDEPDGATYDEPSQFDLNARDDDDNG